MLFAFAFHVTIKADERTWKLMDRQPVAQLAEFVVLFFLQPATVARHFLRERQRVGKARTAQDRKTENHRGFSGQESSTAPTSWCSPIFLGSSSLAQKMAQHAGARGDAPERTRQLFKGETQRKRLAIPMFMGEVQ